MGAVRARFVGARVPLRTTVLGAAALGLAPLTIGLTRFGYAVLLPAMRTDLHWTFAQAGALNTGNGVGYLAGALVAPVLARRLGERRLFLLAFAVTAAALAASAGTAGYADLLALRALTGVTAAVLYVVGAAMATRLAHDSPSPALVLGVYFAGVGPGILVSSALAPVVLREAAGWRLAWLVMAIATAAAMAASAGASPRPATPVVPAPGGVRLGTIRWAVLAFTLYGLGYSGYATFIVAFYAAAGRGPFTLGLFWGCLAVAASASAFAWRPALDRWPGGGGLALTLLVVSLGSALPLLSTDTGLMFASAALFGGAFLAVSTAFAQIVRRALPADRWTAAMGAATALFAVGQAVGPSLVGVLADRAGGLGVGLTASAGCLAAGTVLALCQRRPRLRGQEGARSGG